MKILLRADASLTQGTGHVMRVLTLSEELVAAGHEVHLASAPSGIDWLERVIAESELPRHMLEAHSLSDELLREIAPDWLVVDSYEISAALINTARATTKVLAIVDADSRGIEADIYVDHNVGAENLPWSEFVRERILAGSRYALIRRAIREVRRAQPWASTATLTTILGFMGGTDPTGMIVSVAQAIAVTTVPLQGVVICAPAWREQVDALLADKPKIRVLPPTNDLPALLEATDIAISAAGTSSWELCTLGIPSILIEVVDNQTESLREMTKHGLVIGLSPSAFTGNEMTAAMTRSLELLATDEKARRELSEACASMFDGLGAARVVEAMTRLSAAGGSTARSHG
jgi:UDP-2,4-diacetamido-2,4,6-trideoxy-beta-L-altropyranose hydrolase